MAVIPIKAAPPPPGEDPLAKEMRRRLERADIDFNRHQGRIADCYKFAMPWRHKVGMSQPTDVLDEIFDSTAMTVSEDFAADMLNTFTPQKNNWLEEVPVEFLDEGDKNRIKKDLARRQQIVFAEMARSNLYQALQESYMDLGVGTMALTIDDINIAEPIHCQAIPATELRIDRGPYGFVDGKWRKWKVRAEDISTLWPKARKPDNNEEYKPGDMTEHEVVDGCWRDWSDRGNEAHRYAVMCDGKIIYREDYKGAGSGPMIVARWSRDSTTAWGVGWLYRELPDVKTLNHVRYSNLKLYDRVNDPVVWYQDDGQANLENGVTPGLWIAGAPGSDPPKVIEAASRLDHTMFELDELRSAIRRAAYQDRPEQQGKTPPTATQWADERAERARRMGTPATNLVHELQIPIYRRFVYLLDKRGVLPKITLDGRVVSLNPVSPLLRAQQQERVLRNQKFTELLNAAFGPQMTALIVDAVNYATEMGTDLGITPELIRDKEGLKAAMTQLMPILQNFSGGTAGQPVIPPEIGTVAGGM